MNPYQPPSPSEPSIEDRLERLEAKLGDSKPAGFEDLLLSVFAFLAIILTGAMLFDLLTRAGRWPTRYITGMGVCSEFLF